MTTRTCTLYESECVMTTLRSHLTIRHANLDGICQH
jgi:hypothetical protein